MMFEYWMTTETTKLARVETLRGHVFTADNGSNRVGVIVQNGDGSPAQMTGTVSANIVLPDGTTITQAGGKDNAGRAWVDLPAAALAAEGRIGVYIRLINGTDAATLGGVEGYVKRSMTN